MRTLYISDLDGTLLNANAEVSEYTINSLNQLINKGICFSVATARTPATALLMLEDINIEVPIILMNGVLIYDLKSKTYIKKEILEPDKVEKIIEAMRNVEITGLIYTLNGNELSTYFERVDNAALQEFIDERVLKFNKKFKQINDFNNAKDDIIYFCFMDTHDNVFKLYDQIKNINGLGIEIYQDIYSDENLWFIEVFSGAASKSKAINFLRSEYGFDKVIAFGDNLNDLPMFATSDECYAVANAKNEVKEKATAIIGTNTADSVAKWLEENAI